MTMVRVAEKQEITSDKPSSPLKNVVGEKKRIPFAVHIDHGMIISMKFDVLVSCPVVCHPASQSPQRGSLPRCVAFGLLKGGRRKATSFKGCSF
jgi:hypothetical protein